MGIRSGFRKVAVIGLYCAGIALAQAHNAQAENNAKFAVGPDSNYTLLINTLKSAKSQILINIYEFDQAPIEQGVNITDPIASAQHPPGLDAILEMPRSQRAAHFGPFADRLLPGGDRRKAPSKGGEQGILGVKTR